MKLVLPTLLAILALATPASPSLAQENGEERAFYRVEAIVFTHAGGENDAWPIGEPADYTGIADPVWQRFARQQELERAEDGEEFADSDLEATLSAIETIASLESGEGDFTEAILYPEPWRAIEELSEPMEQARSQLEESGAYHTHAWIGWHQPLEENVPGKAVRIHDHEPISVDWIGLSPTGRPLRNSRPIETIEDLAPEFHYRLDGSIRLRQRQFMHADVALEWRVPALMGPTPFSTPTGKAEFEVHRFEQSRTIRPDRLEYFDSAWLGVLLRVTPYELDAPEAESGNPDEQAESP